MGGIKILPTMAIPSDQPASFSLKPIPTPPCMHLIFQLHQITHLLYKSQIFPLMAENKHKPQDYLGTKPGADL